jgi:hypothetical protein
VHAVERTSRRCWRGSVMGALAGARAAAWERIVGRVGDVEGRMVHERPGAPDRRPFDDSGSPMARAKHQDRS